MAKNPSSLSLLIVTQVMSEEAFNGKIKQIGGCINRIRILSA